MAELVATDLSVRVKQRTLVHGASFGFGSGELITLIGPNGAGKTSLIRALLGLEKPFTGSSILDGKNIRELDSITRARCIAYLPQIRPLAWPSRVRDVVALGRFCHGAAPGRISGVDRHAVERAIEDCDLSKLTHRHSDTLSGGELARMHCARAFAAQAPLLIADEPIAALDPRHQFKILDLIAAYVARGGGALIVLHDIQLAACYATRMLWMKEGQILADGSPDETLSTERLSSIYGIHATVDGLAVNVKGAL